MGSRASRSVEIQVANNTEDITLRNPRTHFYSGRVLKPPQSLVAPCSSTICRFSNRSIFWGCNGVLSYEAETFTLAIFFSNPIDRNRFSVQTGLELSLDKVHKGDLRTTYRRMVRSSRGSSTTSKRSRGSSTTKSPQGSSTTKSPQGSSTTKSPQGSSTTKSPQGSSTTKSSRGSSTTKSSRGSPTTTKSSILPCVILKEKQQKVQVSAGPVTVAATMAGTGSAVIKVEVKERRDSGGGAGRERPENPQEIQRKLLENPETESVTEEDEGSCGKGSGGPDPCRHL